MLLLATVTLAIPFTTVVTALSATTASAALCGQDSWVGWVNASGGPGIRNTYQNPDNPPPTITVTVGTVFHLTGVVEPSSSIRYTLTGGHFYNQNGQNTSTFPTTDSDLNCVVHDQDNIATVAEPTDFSVIATYAPWETDIPITQVVGTVHVTPPSGAGPIVGIGGLCLDDAGASTTNGNPVDLYTCNGTGAQQWTYGSDARLRALGHCLDVYGGGTANGTRVDLANCNGTGAQEWAYLKGGWFNPQSGKCLDDPNSSTIPGTFLQIFSCNGGGNQHWTLP